MEVGLLLKDLYLKKNSKNSKIANNAKMSRKNKY